VVLPLEAIASDSSRPASERLEAWFETLRAIKRRKVLDDPELFQVHHNIVEQAPEIVEEHIATMLNQLERMIAEGVATGEFSRRLEPALAARAFLQATSPFHHPALLLQAPRASEEDAGVLLDLLLAGLRAEKPEARSNVSHIS
jgi:AcrR family transcriptional regulator